MQSHSNYSDEEIRQLLRKIMAEKPSDPAREPEPTAKPSGSGAAASIMRDLSIDEILKKMEAEIAQDKAPPARERPSKTK